LRECRRFDAKASSVCDCDISDRTSIGAFVVAAAVEAIRSKK